MNKWLDESLPNHLPGFCTHQVGAGGFILSTDKKKILCIQEHNSLMPGLWKLPGGLVDAGESLEQGILREIQEETGVKARFKSVLSFRDIQGQPPFGISDLYFICLLEAESDEINVPEIAAKTEIMSCEWKAPSEIQHLNFSKMSRATCRALSLVEDDLNKVLQALREDPKYDPKNYSPEKLLSECSLTPETMQLRGKDNTMYSSEMLKTIARVKL